MPKFALAQINPTVGDIRGNTAKIILYINRARARKADIVVFPELALTGYPPEDLLNMPEFIASNLKALDKIRQATKGITAIVGFADRPRWESGRQRKGIRVRRDNDGIIYNAAALLSNRKTLGIYHKMHLPNYGVFDEKRYFTAGSQCPVFRVAGTTIGINICEDIWVNNGPAGRQAKQGRAKVIVNISSSPFHAGKYLERCQVLSRRARENKAYICYANLIGGQDELVFDGRSMVFNPSGELIARAKAFKEDLLIVDIDTKKAGNQKTKEIVLSSFSSLNAPVQPPVVGVPSGSLDAVPSGSSVPQSVEEEVYEALKLGLRDYIRKNGFKKVLIGLSGGIDSALTALITADALGSENVLCLYLPSEYSSNLSRQCAIKLARNLGIRLLAIPIKGIYQSYLRSLKLSQRKITLTHENLQSRIRGTILMALSNKTGAIVLTTGNKSEMSMGYATLYGDMAGGFALIKDLPKTLVYKLSSYGNELFYNKTGKEPIPLEIITRPPTAELKPDQKDSDTLPEYHILDPILQAYIEENRGKEEIVRMTGAPREVVERVIRMVDKSEYKRRQSPPGVKITPRAFGKDRRFPITNKFI